MNKELQKKADEAWQLWDEDGYQLEDAFYEGFGLGWEQAIQAIKEGGKIL